MVLLWPLIGSQKHAFNFNAYSSNCTSEVSLFIVVQIRDQFVRAVRDSDPGVRIVLVHRHYSDFHSIFTIQATGCIFLHGTNFGVPSNPTFRFR